MTILRQIAKALLPAPVTIRLRAAFKTHEPERALLPALCDPARAGLDIGAALGAYTWPMAKLCRACIAFEPNPRQANYLRRALGCRARVESMALSDHDGEVALVIPDAAGNEKAGQATIAPGAWLEGEKVQRVTVQMRALDSLGLPAVGFLKLDVEGHELVVLKGGANLIARDRPTILVELEERFGAGAIAQVRDLLEPLGYRGFFLEEKTLQPIVAFDPAMHQKMAHWGDVGAYINNFLFIDPGNLASVTGRLAELGYTVRS